MHFDNCSVLNKEPDETSYLGEYFIKDDFKSAESLAFHPIPGARTELLCDKCS